MSFSDNFNLFKTPGHLVARPARSPDHLARSNSQRNLVLRFAIEEVKIGTPDSIELAVKALFKNKIEIPTLNLLLDLHQKSQGIERGAKFAKDASELQRAVIKKIEDMLQEV
ncbi:MAG: hypothetical protein WCG42_04005 [Parachlamydiaceae bacterium]